MPVEDRDPMPAILAVIMQIEPIAAKQIVYINIHEVGGGVDNVRQLVILPAASAGTKFCRLVHRRLCYTSVYRCYVTT